MHDENVFDRIDLSEALPKRVVHYSIGSMNGPKLKMKMLGSLT